MKTKLYPHLKVMLTGCLSHVQDPKYRSTTELVKLVQKLINVKIKVEEATLT